MCSHATFMHTDPKSAKKDSQLKQLFALLGSGDVKAAHKHVDEIDPWSVILFICSSSNLLIFNLPSLMYPIQYLSI